MTFWVWKTFLYLLLSEELKISLLSPPSCHSSSMFVLFDYYLYFIIMVYFISAVVWGKFVFTENNGSWKLGGGGGRNIWWSLVKIFRNYSTKKYSLPLVHRHIEAFIVTIIRRMFRKYVWWISYKIHNPEWIYGFLFENQSFLNV